MRTLCILLLLASPALAQKKKSESGLDYTVNGPKAGASKCPVIIFLHGTGGNSGVWDGWAGEARKRGYVVVMPHSTGVGDKKAGNTGGDNLPRWADVDIAKVVSLAREIQRTWNGDPKRTYLAGYSNGAFYAMEIALRHPEVFSALLCVGGGCNLSPGEEVKHMGAFIIHGTADPSVPFDAGKGAAEKLKSLGLKVEFKEYKGRGHDIFDEEAKNFFDWVPQFVRPFTPGGLKWETDLEKAKEKGGLVWVYLWSKKDAKSPVADFFELDLLTDPDVAEFAKGYACVKLDRDEEPGKFFKATRPSILILSSDGKVLKKFEESLQPAAFLSAVKKLK